MMKKIRVRMLMKGNPALKKRIIKKGLMIITILNSEMRVRVSRVIHQLRFYHYEHLLPYYPSILL